MRRSRVSWLIAIAVTIVVPASATEECVRDTLQPSARRVLEKQAARLLAPDAIDARSLWFCAYGAVNADAVIDSVPRRLPDGSDLVRQAWCQRYEKARPVRWNCSLSEYRMTATTVKIGDTPWRFTIVLGPEVEPGPARRLVDEAIALSSQATVQNHCTTTPRQMDIDAVHSDFATKPSRREKPTFTVYRNEHTWQVSRRLSSMTIELPEGGTPQLQCWSVAAGEL